MRLSEDKIIEIAHNAGIAHNTTIVPLPRKSYTDRLVSEKFNHFAQSIYAIGCKDGQESMKERAAIDSAYCNEPDVIHAIRTISIIEPEK